jgi:hypothetical protein
VQPRLSPSPACARPPSTATESQHHLLALIQSSNPSTPQHAHPLLPFYIIPSPTLPSPSASRRGDFRGILILIARSPFFLAGRGQRHPLLVSPCYSHLRYSIQSLNSTSSSPHCWTPKLSPRSISLPKIFQQRPDSPTDIPKLVIQRAHTTSIHR